MLELPSDVVGTLDALVEARQAARAAEARQFALAAHFADLHAHLDASDVVLPGTEWLRQLGSDGTPAVAEFATLEFAAVMGMRDVAAAALIASALDVRHRMPWLWGQAMACEVPVWQARALSGLCVELDLEAARRVDRELARQLPGMSFSRVKGLVEALVLAALSDEERERRRCEALDRRGVWIDQSRDGVAEVDAVLDAADSVHLGATVDWLARILAEGGVRGTVDERRAKALGVLATPARALQLQQASLLDQLPDDGGATEELCRRDGQAGHTCGTVTVDPEQLLPRTQVVLHLSDEAMVDGAGLVRSPQLKPVLVDWLTDMFADSRVAVRPVIDANHQAPGDAYECPPTMREAITIRNPHECFPWSTRRSAGLDLDHTIPCQPQRTAPDPVEGQCVRSGTVDKGSITTPEPVEGQWEAVPHSGGVTHPSNLAPLSRKVHRAKTHGDWQVQQPWPGVLLWQSPHGYRFLVTPTRTIDLGRPEPPRRHRSAPHLVPAA